MKKFFLIDKWDINSIREDAAKGNNLSVHMPYLEKGIATGRARCRSCGEKIVKGEPEIKFPYAFTDGGSYNSWTAVECHIHGTECQHHDKDGITIRRS